MHSLNKFSQRLRNSSFFKDSFWAVFGNGLGNFLMLLSGILIARFLGKDLYGEYGVVKSTMFLIALFATFGLGDTSTKYIAEYIQKDVAQIRNIINASLRIVCLFSGGMCLLLLISAEALAEFVKVPHMAVAFRFLGIIIVFRALNTVGAGLLGGFKDYRKLGINNVIAGLSMLSLAIPLTLLWDLKGSLIALLLSQVLLSVLNLIAVSRKSHIYSRKYQQRFEKEMLSFSFPFALNEFVYTVCSWLGTLLMTRYSSVGELGIGSAAGQWNSIIMFMPGLLGNVILSYLSTTARTNERQHSLIIRRMLLVNFVCTVIPLFIVVLFSDLITELYGPTFVTMKPVLVVSIIGTIFACLTRVFQSNLMSEGKKWRAFTIRSSYNFLQLVVSYVVLRLTNGVDAAYNLAWVSSSIALFSLFLYLGDYMIGRSVSMKYKSLKYEKI